MLAYILSVIIAVFSLILFGLAFFSKGLHRRDDFLWSGVGLFYALVLWICAGQITGAVLLGQAAATTLLLSLGWQTLHFRDAIAHPEKGINLSFSVIDSIQGFLGSPSSPKVVQPSSMIPTDEPPISETLSNVTEEVSEKVSDVAAAVSDKVSDFVEENKLDEKLTDLQSGLEDVVADAKAATSKKEGFSVKKFLNFRKTSTTPTPVVPKSVVEEIDDFEMEVVNKVPEPPTREVPRIVEPELSEPEVIVDRFVPSDWVKPTEDSEAFPTSVETEEPN